MFGYGSLVAPSRVALGRAIRADGFVTDLRGMRRGWGVAMDNRVDLPAYKFYVDGAGRRPEVSVAFLDVSEADDPAATVNGLCLPVDPSALAALDVRERNYIRMEVTERIAAGIGGVRVFTYVGSPEGRERLRVGRARGTAVIHADYLHAVRAGFGALGAAELSACEPSLAPDGLPVIELTRHALA